MPRRQKVALVLEPELVAEIQALADENDEGTFARATRRLLKEALAARREREAMLDAVGAGVHGRESADAVA